MALVGRWDLQDPSTNVDEPAINEVDVAANGVFKGAVAPLASGGPGGRYLRAVTFNGMNETDGRMEIPATVNVGTEFSFSVWVEEAGQTNATILGRFADANNFVTFKAIQPSRRVAYHRNTALDNRPRIRFDSSLSGWTHYVIIYSADSIKLYVNGQIADTLVLNASSEQFPSLADNKWVLGSDLNNDFPSSSVGHWTGAMAGLAIFDHALSVSEVTEEFERGQPQFTSAPKITGTLAVGQDLQVEYAETDGQASFQWLLDGVEIPGQTASIFTVDEEAVDGVITVRVTLENGVGSTTQVSAAIETPSTSLEDDFGFATDGDMLRRIGGSWQITRDTPIHVRDMPGNDFDEQFQNALSRLSDYHGAKVVNFPDGGVRVKQGLVLADPSTPASSSQLMNQVVFRGGRNTRLFWDESVTNSDELIMLDIPAAYQMRLENITLRSRYPNGTSVENKIGIYHHSAWDWNTNTARGSVFESLVIDNFETGLYVGSPAGPDITLVNWNNCLWTQCKTGVVVEGANVAGYVFDNCQIGTSKQDGVGWRLKYAVPKYFDGDTNKPQYLDVWGNPVALDWTDTIDRPAGSEEWNKRITDSAERDRNDSSFDATTASSIGGGPDIAIRNCNTTMGYATEDVAQYAIVSDSAHVDVDNLRVEGEHSAVLKTEPVRSILNPPSNDLNFHLNRFRIVMREVNCVGDKVPYDLAGSSDRLAGFPVEIIGGYYNNDYLPAPARLPRKLITWTGDIRGPVGLTAADPDLQLSYQMDGPTGAVTTLTDSSSYSHDLTVMGSGGELVPGISGQGNAFDLKGTAYAELDAASAASALNERQKGTVSLRFKINSLATTDDRFAGLLSRRIAENDDGWALTLDGHNDSLRIRHDSGTTFITLPQNEQLQVGQWYHLALVMLGDGNVTFWLDGNKLNTVAWSFPVSANSIPLQIGVDGAYLNTRRFNGLIDDIRIYSEPLSSLRLQELISQ